MNIATAINLTDDLYPNQYSVETKVRWLSQLDLSIKQDILDNYLKDGEKAKPPCIFCESPLDLPIQPPKTEEDDETSPFPYDPGNLEQELLVEAPFDDLYLTFLQMKVEEANGDAARYNNSAVMYNSQYSAYEKWYNKTHTPKPIHLHYF